MASLKSQDVTIKTDQGDKVVKAVVLGSWAVHKALRGSGFSLTHIPTGLLAFTGKSKKAVLGALEVIGRDRSLLHAKTDSDVRKHTKLFKELAQSTSGKKPVIDLETILMDEGLQNLGERYGKAGTFYGYKGGARAVSVGRRDVLLNVFYAMVSRPDQVKRPDTRWENYLSELKTKMTEDTLRKWAKYVKNGPSMISVRDAARDAYNEKIKGDSHAVGVATGRMKKAAIHQGDVDSLMDYLHNGMEHEATKGTAIRHITARLGFSPSFATALVKAWWREWPMSTKPSDQKLPHGAARLRAQSQRIEALVKRIARETKTPIKLASPNMEGTMDLRQEITKLANEVPEMRQHLVPLLSRTAKKTEAQRDAEMYAKGYRHKILWGPGKKGNKDALYGKTVKDVTKLIREDFPDEKGYKVVEIKKPKKACGCDGGGDEMMAKFEEGKPADPTKNMTPEEKAKWEKYEGRIEHIASELDEMMAGREHSQKGKGYGLTGPDRRGPGDKPPKAKGKCFYETGDEGDRCYTTTNGGPGGARSEKTYNKGDSPKKKWKKYEEVRWGK